jgi:predicted peptidase
MQQPQHFSTTITREFSMNYLLYLPPGYEDKADWPLILFLHGRGERGDDLELLKLHGLPLNIDQGQDYPFVIVSPQCPVTRYWPELVAELNSLLGYAIQTYKVDSRRVYLTGLSMGGYGTWYLAARYPQRFAAIAPICGGGAWWMPEQLTTVPAWVFHGDADPVIPISESTHMVNKLKELGANVRFTVYPDVGHNAWAETYNNPELYKWFLSQRLP